MNLVIENNGQLTTTSKIVSDVFEKQHKDVLRDIRRLDCSDDFRERNFALSTYTSKQNKELKCVSMTRDGFSFLCMGFIGKKAAKWKEDYINAFNEMEKGLLNLDSRITKLTLDAEKIKEAGSEWSRMGHEINKAKKGHLLEVKKVMEDVQLKLDW